MTATVRPSPVTTSTVIARSGPFAPAARAGASSSGVTSHGPIELAKSLPLAGPSRTVVSSRWRSRADQSLKIVKPADRLLGPAGREIVGRRVDEGADLELEVELVAAPRGPHRVARPAELGDVAEVEDRQPVPRLGDLAAAARPHRRDVTLEGVEVAQARRVEDGRPEGEVGRVEDRLVVLLGRDEVVDKLAEGGHPQAAGEMRIERRDRPPEDRAVMRATRVGGDQATAGNLEVEPLGCFEVEGRRQPVGRPRRRMALADVGDLHAASLASRAVRSRRRGSARRGRPGGGQPGLKTMSATITNRPPNPIAREQVGPPVVERGREGIAGQGGPSGAPSPSRRRSG